MSIQELMAVAPPPKKPLETEHAQEWKAYAESAVLPFPSDLYEFGMTYGTGLFGDLRVYNPLSSKYHGRVTGKLSQYKSIKDEPLFDVPYALYPERPGLYPWADDADGRSYWWLTEGEKSQWPVIVSISDDFERWQMSMTTFLAQMLAGELKSSLLPARILKSMKKFKATMST